MMPFLVLLGGREASWCSPGLSFVALGQFLDSTRKESIYLKSFLKKQISKDHIILLGSADVEKKLVKFEYYLKILKKIKNKYKKKKIF